MVSLLVLIFLGHISLFVEFVVVGAVTILPFHAERDGPSPIFMRIFFHIQASRFISFIGINPDTSAFFVLQTDRCAPPLRLFVVHTSLLVLFLTLLSGLMLTLIPLLISLIMRAHIRRLIPNSCGGV